MIGKTISHYRILEKLGEGGMGEVYKADDLVLGRPVALKFFSHHLLDTGEEKARILHEARYAATLSHPSICTVYEIDETTSEPFIVMEFIEGSSIREKMQLRPLALKEAVGIAMHVAEGLVEAHEKGIIHRDIKSGNIMISDKGQAMIMDFGLAKLRTQKHLATEETTLGTVAYMSPEQARGEDVDHRTDIWSLGVVLYEMLSGNVPFRGDYDQAVTYAILNDEPEPLAAARPEVPPELERIVSRALAKNLDERYQHMDEMLVDLRLIAKDLASGKTKEVPAAPKRRETRRPYLYAGALLLIVSLIVIGLYFLRGYGDTIDSLAVLPLKNLSGSPDQEYIVEGMTEALINELSRIKALRVISRTSVMRFKDSTKAVPEIARELNVDAIVEGSIQREGDQLRITVQLIQAVPEKHIWANDYDRHMRDMLTLQKEIARAVAQNIKVALSPAEQKTLASSRTVNPEAEEEYLKGRFNNNRFTVESAQKALELFKAAIGKDPNYALAYVGLAESYDILAALAAVPDSEAWPKVKEAASKALEIDETLADAHVLLADVAFVYEWNWKEAETAYKRAIELNPGYSRAHDWYALYLSCMLRHNEAIAEITKARELDPLSLGVRVNEVAIYGAARRYDKAEQLVSDLLDYYPDSYMAQLARGYLYLRESDYAKALSVFQKMSSSFGDQLVKSSLAASYAFSGQKENAQALLKDLIEQSKKDYVPAYCIAIVYYSLADLDRTFEWLEKAFKERSNSLVFMRTLSMFDPLLSEPRFQALMKKMGLE